LFVLAELLKFEKVNFSTSDGVFILLVLRTGAFARVLSSIERDVEALELFKEVCSVLCPNAPDHIITE
jgi:hypothetical protein